jgi:hypothetical protein
MPPHSRTVVDSPTNSRFITVRFRCRRPVFAGHVKVAMDGLADSWRLPHEYSPMRHGDLVVGAWVAPDPFATDMSKAVQRR